MLHYLESQTPNNSLALWERVGVRVGVSRLQPALALCLALGSAPLQAQTTAPAQTAVTTAPGAAPAAAACPAQPAYPLPASEPALQALLAQINAMVSVCLQNAPFHAWRGAVLLALHQPAAASEALERALLLEPEQPGALLDYADALLVLGDSASARGLLLQLVPRSDLPGGLRPLLARALAATDPNRDPARQPGDPTAWRTRWLLTSALGHDNNLNNAPLASVLTLTFPQGALTLPLLASAQPQSGAAALNSVQWQGLKPVGSQLWLLQTELRSRHTAPAASRYQQAELAASWLQAPEAARQWIVRSGFSRVDFGGQRLLQSARLSALHQWQGFWGQSSNGLLGSDTNFAAVRSTAPGGRAEGSANLGSDPNNLLSGLLAACRPSAGAEAEERRYPMSPELNGRYTGLLAAVNCASADAPGSQALFSQQFASLQLRLGQDQPTNQFASLQLRLGQDLPDSASRPGGSYQRAEIRATWEGRYRAFKANTDYSYSQQRDASGYSPLLSDNLARRASRHSLRAELAHPLPPGWLAGTDGFVSVELSRQRSNLAVFESRQTAIYAGLRWSLQ